MTDLPQAPADGTQPEPDTEIEVVPRRGHILEVLAWIQHKAPTVLEPSAIITETADSAGGPVVVVRFDAGPSGVVVWASALGFPAPVTTNNVQLRQVMVFTQGMVFGWRVEIQHVRTDPNTGGRRTAPSPTARRDRTTEVVTS